MATTAVPIKPSHVINGYTFETNYGKGGWLADSNYPSRLAEVEKEIKKNAQYLRMPLTAFRVVAISKVIAAFPSDEYIEELQLKGYQGARRGEPNPYGPGDNNTLWAEGAEYFAAGSKLFGA